MSSVFSAITGTVTRNVPAHNVYNTQVCGFNSGEKRSMAAACSQAAAAYNAVYGGTDSGCGGTASASVIGNVCFANFENGNSGGTFFSGGTVGAVSDQPVIAGDALEEFDDVIVGVSSTAEILMSDDATLELSAGTEMSVTANVYSPETPASDSVILNLVTGSLRVATGLLASRNPDKFRIIHGTATVGIRG
jgi:hypothetical protein